MASASLVIVPPRVSFPSSALPHATLAPRRSRPWLAILHRTTPRGQLYMCQRLYPVGFIQAAVAETASFIPFTSSTFSRQICCQLVNMSTCLACVSEWFYSRHTARQSCVDKDDDRQYWQDHTLLAVQSDANEATGGGCTLNGHTIAYKIKTSTPGSYDKQRRLTTF
ncbi:hypothetical protein T440DRAFT_541732 [Plenodomus tracheiphilus IPT5]|uniref:Uncharacterized protein n=1 Tax=Plenodomus tracheiphilus IPT5 TaxID=1408161 RepID=A0A6A7ASQ4_9PLEO|nr:hypothetical protein T440DRAFT_541732 [Plenodomus tracheiphilus IPT5]